MKALLERIESALASADSPGQRGELLARRGCYLARVGRFDLAREQISELRAHFPASISPRASVWTMIAEGVLQTYESLSSEGLDRMVRAQALSLAMRDRTLIAWSSAWRAHLQSERSDFTGMARSLDLAFNAADPTEHEAIARGSMVLANALASCGRQSAAARWYVAAWHHSLEAGDHASLDALMYNKAAFRMGWLRAESCIGVIGEGDLALVGKEIESARNYQTLVGVLAVNNFAELWRARIHLLRGDFVTAARLLRDVRGMEPFAKYNFDQALIDLEIAYCEMRLGRADSYLAPSREGIDFSSLHRDEQLVAAWLWLQLALEGSEAAKIAALRSDLERAQEAYEDEKRTLVGLLVQFDKLVPLGVPEAILRRAEPHQLQ